MGVGGPRFVNLNFIPKNKRRQRQKIGNKLVKVKTKFSPKDGRCLEHDCRKGWRGKDGLGGGGGEERGN